MSKVNIMCSIDQELDFRIKHKRMTDDSFQVSPIINAALWSFFEKDNVGIEEKNKILEQMNEIKEKRTKLDNQITSLSLQLYEIQKKEKEQEVENEKMKEIKLNTLLANRPD